MNGYSREQIEQLRNDYLNKKIYIDYISDDCYPNAVGHYEIVQSIDDAGQLHCVMQDGCCATVCKAYGDVFFKI